MTKKNSFKKEANFKNCSGMRINNACTFGSKFHQNIFSTKTETKACTACSMVYQTQDGWKCDFDKNQK